MASLELARGLGFERIGSRLDEEDGTEDIFMRIVSAWSSLELSDACLHQPPHKSR